MVTINKKETASLLEGRHFSIKERGPLVKKKNTVVFYNDLITSMKQRTGQHL